MACTHATRRIHLLRSVPGPFWSRRHILAVRKSLSIPADAKRVDYRGKYIIPGLVSDHSHVGNSRGTEQGDRFYTRENVLRNSSSDS